MPSVVTRRRRNQNAQAAYMNMEGGSGQSESQANGSKQDDFVSKYAGYAGYAGIPVLVAVLGLYILYRAMSKFFFPFVSSQSHKFYSDESNKITIFRMNNTCFEIVFLNFINLYFFVNHHCSS